MDFENFLEPEVGIAAVIAAAVFSPRARKVLRRGLVYGTAGVLVAGDAITSFTKNINQNVQHMRTANETTGHEEAPSDNMNKSKEKIAQ